MNAGASMPAWLPLVLLAVAALWGVTRALAGAVRARGWRLGARVLLNLAVASVLGWLLLWTAPQGEPPRILTVWTAGADAARMPASSPADAAEEWRPVRLPGAPPVQDADPEPDLGSALRRAGPVSKVRVIGDGLAAHDRATVAASGLPLEFDPAPLRPGLVDLEWPVEVLLGRRFTLGGRWQTGGPDAMPALEAELLSPGGQRVDRQPVGADGRFELHGTALVAGSLRWQLRVQRLATGEQPAAVLEVTPIDVVAQVPRPLRVQVLSGGADPDLKYLRRWATDAGLELRSRVVLTVGIAVQGAQAPAALDAEGLDALDLLIVDERSWAALPTATHATILAAVRRGLGLLLRLRALPPPAVGTEWAGLGLRWQADTSLAMAVSLRTRLRLPDTAPLFGRLRLKVSAPLAQVLLDDDDGQPLALVWPHGRGRLGAWWWLDSFKLRLGGQPDAHAEVWSRAVEQLARPRADPAPEWLERPRVGERVVVCGLDPARRWQVRSMAAAASPVALALVADSDGAHCAAWWPTAPGWHALEADAIAAEEAAPHWPVSVRAADSLPATIAAERQAATLALVGNRAVGAVPAPAARTLSRAWCWALLLTLLTALWWLERAPAGSPRT